MERLIEQSHPSLDLAVELLARIRTEADARGLTLAIGVVDAGGISSRVSGWTARRWEP